MAHETHTSPLARQDGLVLFGLLACLLIVFAPYFVTGSFILPDSDLGTDFDREVWPLATLIRDSVRESGEIPLWRTYLLSGTPVVGHPVAPLFYPPHWLIVILPLPLALNLDALLHLWWSGVGVYLCLRLLAGTRREAAFVGAMIFALAPKWIAHLSGGHWPMIAAVAWWPWAWLFFHRYWQTGRWRWAILLGVALGVQAINHASIMSLCAIWLGVCTVGYARWRVADWSMWRDWLRRSVLSWTLALIVMFGLAAGQLLPLSELLPYTDTSLTLDEAAFGSLPPALLTGILLPPTLKFPEWVLFPGAVTLILVVIGGAAPRPTRIRWWLVAIAISLLMALGQYTPLYRIVYATTFGFRGLRVPTRWWVFAIFALAMLSSVGIERWLDGTIPHHTVARVIAVLCVIYLAAAGLALAMPGTLPFIVFPHVITLPLAGALVIWSKPARWKVFALIAILLADVGWLDNNLIRPGDKAELMGDDRAVAEFLQPALAGGGRVFSPYSGLSQAVTVNYGLQAADGYDPFAFVFYRELVAEAVGCDFDGYVVSIPAMQTSGDAEEACPVEAFAPRLKLLHLLNVRHVHFTEPVTFPGGEEVYADGDHWVYDIGPGYGHAFGVAQGELVSADACADRLSSIDPASAALVEDALPFETIVSPPQMIAYVGGTNTAQFGTQGAGLLVRAETWAPGWTATIDGADVEVLRVDCALQGVWLPPGEHEVRFEYRPQGYLIGRWISLAVGVIVLGGATWFVFRRWRKL